MVKGTTKSGFEFETNEKILDDMKFVRILSRIKTQPLYIDELAVRLLGEAKADALYTHLEDEDGIVSPEAFSNELMEIISAMGETAKK